MFEVAKNSTIQNKLSVEIEDMFERTEGNPEYADIVQMKYLDACLNGNFRTFARVQLIQLIKKIVNPQKHCANIRRFNIWYGIARMTSQ